MSELRLYSASFEIEDDPAYFSGDALVMARSNKEAKALAREAAKDAYYEQAGGWASSATKVTSLRCGLKTLPTKPGVVMTRGTYSR